MLHESGVREKKRKMKKWDPGYGKENCKATCCANSFRLSSCLNKLQVHKLMKRAREKKFRENIEI